MSIINYLVTYKDGFIAGGVILTAIISSISLYFSVRNNKAVHYVNTVTENRVEWIYKLRSLISQYIALTNIYDNNFYNSNSEEDIEKSGKHLSECRRVNSEIKLMLNFSDEKDAEIISVVDKLMNSFQGYYYEAFNCEVSKEGFFINNDKMDKYQEDVNDCIECIIGKVQIYLKAEWNRVKYESKGEIYEKEIQKFDYNELEEKYKNKDYT